LRSPWSPASASVRRKIMPSARAVLLCVIALLLNSGCERRPAEPLRPYRPPGVAPRVPEPYAQLPAAVELDYTRDTLTWKLLAYAHQGEPQWYDSLVVLEAGPRDELYIRVAAYRFDAESVLGLEPELTDVTGDGQVELLLRISSGGNSPIAESMLVLSFPHLRLLRELEGAPQLRRVPPDSLPVLLTWREFWTDEELPVAHAQVAWVVDSIVCMVPTLSDSARQALQLYVLEQERQRARSEYSQRLARLQALLRRSGPLDWAEMPDTASQTAVELTRAAVEYLYYSRRLGQHADAARFYRTQLPRLRQILPEELLEYLRAAFRTHV
jgi:hypothetical protein